MREETKAKINQVQALIAEGKTVQEACAQLGIKPSYFYSARSLQRRAARTVRIYSRKKRTLSTTTHAVFPIGGGGGQLKLEGSPELLARFCREVGRAQ